MFRRFRNSPEIKYIGGVMLAMAFAQILATTAVLKEILFVVQFILIEIVLTVSFQVLSRDTKKKHSGIKTTLQPYPSG